MTTRRRGAAILAVSCLGVALAATLATVTREKHSVSASKSLAVLASRQRTLVLFARNPKVASCFSGRQEIQGSYAVVLRSLERQVQCVHATLGEREVRRVEVLARMRERRCRAAGNCPHIKFVIVRRK